MSFVQDHPARKGSMETREEELRHKFSIANRNHEITLLDENQPGSDVVIDIRRQVPLQPLPLIPHFILMSSWM
jgi:hypothetical protein